VAPSDVAAVELSPRERVMVSFSLVDMLRPSLFGRRIAKSIGGGRFSLVAQILLITLEFVRFVRRLPCWIRSFQAEKSL
jgi:hypothetical protein